MKLFHEEEHGYTSTMTADQLFDVGEPVTVVPCPELPPEKPPIVEPDRTQAIVFDPPLAGATISECGKYRYVLWRKFKSSGPRVMWNLLNPSTADAENDDPTIGRVTYFSKREGAAEAFVVNPFAYRATKPSEMRKMAGIDCDVYGRENIDHILTVFGTADLCIVGWGNGGEFQDAGRKLMKILECANEKRKIPIKCLGVTKQGHPKHPLYISNSQPLIDFSYATEADF